MDFEAFSDIVRTRRSIRKWRNIPVPREMVLRALELATWAPNGGNYQGWYFVVIMKKELIEEIADHVQEAMDLIASWPEAQPWSELVDRYRRFATFFREAPVLVAVFATAYESPADKILQARQMKDPVAATMIAHRQSAPTGVQSAAAAITTFLLTLHAMGLGGVWLAAPLFAKTQIQKALDAPPEHNLIACVALGYPDEEPKVDRRPLHEVTRVI